LLTPYVLTNPEQAQQEAKRIYDSTDSKKTLWPRGWSQSPLRNDEPAKDEWKKKKDKKDKTKVEDPAAMSAETPVPAETLPAAEPVPAPAAAE